MTAISKADFEMSTALVVFFMVDSSDMGDQNPTRHWHDDADQVVGGVHSISLNLPVRPVTALANNASAAPARPAGYAGRYRDPEE